MRISSLTDILLIALGWLEYCNLDTDTHYANLRRQNGREKPYGVKYWALGNEVWGPWSVDTDTHLPFIELLTNVQIQAS